MAKEQFVGTWKLISTKGTNPAVGCLMYDAGGNMSAKSIETNRPLFKDPDDMTLEEGFDAFMSMRSYFGTYDVEGDTVIHHVEASSMPQETGTDQIRFFEFSEDKLTLTLSIKENDNTIFVLVWERIWPLE